MSMFKIFTRESEPKESEFKNAKGINKKFSCLV